MKTPARALALVLATLLGTSQAGAQEILVSSNQVLRFQNQDVGGQVGRLIWRGGLVMDSDEPDFGGLSGLGFVDSASRLVMISDRGNFVSGQLIYDEVGRPFSLVGVEVEPVRNSSGAILPRAFARDAEGLAVIEREGAASAVRVAFENLTRVADFELTDARPGGPAREVAIPDWISSLRTNEALESICIAPPASPIAGSTLLILESAFDDAGNHAAFLLGNRDRGRLSLTPDARVNPTDCAFLPNGDLLVLERGVALFAFVMVLRRIPAAEVQPGAVMRGEVLLEAAGADIDNMEALAVHQGPDGETRITIVADNNFNDWERNLLLEFSLPE